MCVWVLVYCRPPFSIIWLWSSSYFSLFLCRCHWLVKCIKIQFKYIYILISIFVQTCSTQLKLKTITISSIYCTYILLCVSSDGFDYFFFWFSAVSRKKHIKLIREKKEHRMKVAKYKCNKQIITNKKSYTKSVERKEKNR